MTRSEILTRQGARFLLATIVALTLGKALVGCRSVRAHFAMETVRFRYHTLFYAVEDGDQEGIRQAAGALVEALDDPTIVGYSSTSDYRTRLAECVESVQHLSDPTVETLDRVSALKQRKKVSSGCQGCHESYRQGSCRPW